MGAPALYYHLQKNTRTLSSWAGIAFWLLQAPVLYAQNKVSFEASINTKEVLVGVPFELNFTLLNADGTRFTPPNFSGFRTGGFAEMRGMSFVNGRSSTSQTWSTELTANKPGTYTIGPATVVADGRTVATKPLTIKVLPVASTGKGNVNIPPGSDDKIFVAAEFDQKEASVGQQVTWRIRLYTQLSVDGYDIIALPDFQGFYSKEKVRYDKRVEFITLRKKKYAVRTLHEEALFPQEPGTLTVGAARVSVGIEQPGAQGFLFGPKPVSLQTQALSLKINALPQPQPEAFTGAVGQYTWGISADSTSITTDDALTILVEVKGNGDARRFAAPKITVPPGCEIFEPRVLEEEEYEGELEILHRKKFEYVVLPKDTGIQEIRPILSYFDVDSNRYCQLQADPIRITVSPGKNFQSPNAPPSQPLSEPSMTQGSGFLEKIIDGLNSPIGWSILALPFLVLGIIILLKRRSPLPSPAPKAPTLTAVEMPIHKTDHSESVQQRFIQTGQYLKDGNPRRFYDSLFKTLQTWLMVQFGLQTAQMNGADISKLLLQRGATPIRTQAFLSVWHSCEQAIYGGQASEEQMESTWQMAQQVVEALERETRATYGH